MKNHLQKASATFVVKYLPVFWGQVWELRK